MPPMLARTHRMLPKALLGVIVTSLTLVACSPAETPTEPTVAPTAVTTDKAIDTTETKAPDAAVNKAETAAQAVSVYANAINAKNPANICDALDPAYAKVVVDSYKTGETCVQVFEKIFTSDTTPNAPKDIDIKVLGASGKKVSETMYSFPLAAIVPDDKTSITVTKVGSNWKVGLPPEQAEAAKQIAENNPTNSSPTQTAK